MEFKLAPIARRDVLEITDYYNEISTGLAERFVTELEFTLQGLCGQPGMGSPRYAHFLADHSLRVWQLDHFPLLIFYRIDGDLVDVLRVLHERRDLSADLVAR
ncbi:type II toxin-antitoxin system RelE/ParE family toxin [Duganella sp. LX20W]|uniref:Type II toxin-antitoxin system RelE/ParE family toxin n=1 Tax=Rugamonas brunnea TaxID=2758569 RepID=A0A7W2EVF6_9BURK|nr:type II toxin-antitoxin system RelE/ParE family toxin [Rugamonas brunnea]MBA5639319.1 type II toxin-antitoxin system RelE/ParE family toxin [Rugamonas brunnea]